jgi:hypothetical protein
LFTLTWGRKATPLGLPYYQLAASAPRISGSGFGSWRSPGAQNADRGGQNATERTAGGHTVNLQDQALLASWPTTTVADSWSPLAAWRSPNTTDYKGRSGPNCAAFQQGNINRLADQVHGMTSNGSPAPTARRGQLNPAFSLWLQGYPPEWENCAPRAMRSSRNARPSSSEQQRGAEAWASRSS